MQVFFDDQIFVSQEQGGISRYFCELARALDGIGVKARIFGGITRNAYLARLNQNPGRLAIRALTRRDRLRINKFLAHVSGLWRRWDFAKARRGATDLVYHATNYTVDPWVAARADATCVTVFDMIGELFGDAADREWSLDFKRRGVRNANRILCISRQTQHDFSTFLPEAADKTDVTLLAANLPTPLAQELAVAKEHAPFLLLVGKRHGYKNGVMALRAFAELAVQEPGLRLVCFGGEPLDASEARILREARVVDRSSFLAGDDALLAAFYAQAVALLYPSKYEGFGLPVLEAMQWGCPVITTPCSSLPEVAGQAAILIPPNDFSGFAQAAHRLLHDPNWRQGRIAAGRAQCQRFSWTRTAHETKACYDRALASRAPQSGAGAPKRERAFSPTRE